MINQKFYERSNLSSKNVLFMREEKYILQIAITQLGSFVLPRKCGVRYWVQGEQMTLFWALFDITEFLNIYFDRHVMILQGASRYISYIWYHKLPDLANNLVTGPVQIKKIFLFILLINIDETLYIS